jgi:hypothetical protein
MKGKLGAYGRFLRGLPGFLNTPMSFQQARDAVSHRLDNRETSFLSLMDRAVYGNPSSPYAPHLSHAGCGYGDMVDGVKRLGLEAFLRSLKDGGVSLSLDEFKGTCPVSRGASQWSFEFDDFQNPFVSGACEMTTGGTTGRPRRTYMDLDFLSDWATYDHIFFRMLEINGLPLAIWYPGLPASTGIPTCLRYARIGFPADRWFCILPDSRMHAKIEYRLATAVIVWASRLSRSPLPRPEPVTVDQAETVLDWVLAAVRLRGRCVLQSYVSPVVRVSRLASEKGHSLAGVQFIVGSEPLTAAKAQAIEATGARVFPRYCSTELGAIAIGCGNQREPGEYHLASDSVAIVQDAPDSGQSAPFYFTSLLRTAPVVMLNVRMGDSGLIDRNPCGCLMEEVGLTTHLRQVGSFERATGEGMTVCVRALVQIADSVLPSRYGGSSVDYQWVEGEDENALTRLWLRIDPRLGAIDESDVAQTVITELRKAEGGVLAARMWHDARTIRVLREPPRLTPAGKALPWVTRHTGK